MKGFDSSLKFGRCLYLISTTNLVMLIIKMSFRPAIDTTLSTTRQLAAGTRFKSSLLQCLLLSSEEVNLCIRGIDDLVEYVSQW